MSPATKELMRLILEKKIAHAGNPPLRWMVDNLYVSADAAGNIKPNKQKATERIDGAVATIMARITSYNVCYTKLLRLGEICRLH